MTKFVFSKNKEIQLNVRIDSETNTLIHKIAENENAGVVQVVRELIRVGLIEYKKEKKQE